MNTLYDTHHQLALQADYNNPAQTHRRPLLMHKPTLFTFILGAGLYLSTPLPATAQEYPEKAQGQIKENEKTGEHSVVMKQKFPYTMDEVYTVLTDYKNFPEYMPHTRVSEVIKEQGDDKWVKYKLVFLAWFDVNYTLKVNHKKRSSLAKIAWTFDSGDYFEDLHGSWQIEQLFSNKLTADGTGVVYTSVIETKAPIPSAILNILTKSSVYDLFEAVGERLEHNKKKAEKPTIASPPAASPPATPKKETSPKKEEPEKSSPPQKAQ